MSDERTEQIISANELMDRQFAPRWNTVDGFLPAGTFLLGGEPKIGKTRFVTQLCFCVSTGRPFLGMETHRSTVLYFSLEDTMASLQERLIRMFGPNWDGSHLQLATETGDPGTNILFTVKEFLKRQPDTRLVVIDPLQKVRENAGTTYSYSVDYDFMKPFKAFSDRHNLTLLLVHHTRKQKGETLENPFDELSGTQGLRGAADGTFILYRLHGEKYLAQQGRVIPERSYSIRSRSDSLQWELLRCMDGFPDEVQEEPLLHWIDALIGDAWEGSATELLVRIRALDPLCGYQPNTLTRKLNALTGRLRSEKDVEFLNRRTSGQRVLCFTRSKAGAADEEKAARVDVQAEPPPEEGYHSEYGIFYELAEDDPDATIDVFDSPAEL